MHIICILLGIYWFILLARVLASWFPIPPSGPIATAYSFVFNATEPVLRPLRNLLSPIRMGRVAFDLSPIIAFIVLSILQRYVCAAA